MNITIEKDKVIIDGVEYIRWGKSEEITEIKEVKTEDNILNHSNLINLVKTFESFFQKAYRCPAGVPTIGYGTIKYSDGRSVQLGETISKEQAEVELNREIEEKWNGIKGLILVPLNVNQKDALVSFAYNCGVQAFKTSTLLKKINANQLDDVPNQLMKWVNANGKALPGLWRRRLAESLLFMGIKEIPSKYDNDYANMKYFPADWKKYI